MPEESEAPPAAAVLRTYFLLSSKGAVVGRGEEDLELLPDRTEAEPATDADLLPPDSDSEGREGEEQSIEI